VTIIRRPFGTDLQPHQPKRSRHRGKRRAPEFFSYWAAPL